MKLPPLVIQPDDADSVQDGWRVVRQRDFSGGENQNTATCAPNEFLVAENCLINPYGFISKVPGLVTAVTGSYLANCFFFNPFVGYGYIFTSSGLYSSSNWAAFSNYTLKSATYTTMTSAIAIKDTTYFSTADNGGTMFYVTGGGSPVSIANTGDFKSLVFHNNVLWGIDVNGNLRFSSPTLTSWDLLDLISCNDPLAMLYATPGGLIAVGQKYIFAVYGSSRYDISVQRITDTESSPYGDSVAIGGISIFRQGIKQLRLQGVENITGDKQYPYIRDVLGGQAVFLPTSSNDRVLNYTYFLNRGSSIMMPVISANGAVFKRYSGDEHTTGGLTRTSGISPDYVCFVLSGSSPNIKALDRDTYDTTRTLKIQTRHETFGTLRPKVFKRFMLDLDSDVNAVTIKAYVNKGAAITVANAQNLVAGENSIYLWDSNGGALEGQTISIEITTTNAPIIRGMGMEFRETGGLR